MEYAIETLGLSKTYKGGIKALKSVDLKIRPGTCFGLLGPNGAGKSTLVKTLLSIVRPTAGDARLLGKSFRDPEARRSVGYLPEGHRFPRYLTGRGVCSYFGRLSGLSGPELRHEIDEKLGLVGMGEWADTKIGKYSKGMMQRVGLAQAMLGNPRITFLDEPTDGVDPSGRREMRDVIKGFGERGSTVFLNSHLLSEVEKTCDEIAILHKGELISQGSVAQVTASMRSEGSALLVVFKTSRVPEALWTKLAARGARKTAEDTFELELASEKEIPRVMDELRAGSVEVYTVRPIEMNLEDAFIALVTQQDDEDERSERP